MKRAVTALIALNGLSAFGSGLAYPYTALHLNAALGVAGVSAFYGVAAGANLSAAALLASGRLRPRPTLLGLAGTLLLAAGWFGTAAAGSLPAVAAGAVLVGAGQGCLLVAMVPVLHALTGIDERRAVFARRYRALNLGLGLGAAAAGLATGLLALGAVPWLLAANAATYLPLTWAFWRVHRRIAPRAAAAAESDAGKSDPDRSRGWGWLRGAALAAIVFQAGAYLLAHSQFEATAPLVAAELMGVALGAVSVMLLVNTAVVVFTQSFVTRALSGRGEAFGLRVAVALWAGSYAVAAFAAFGDSIVRYGGLLVFAVVFALGECAYACSYHPWLIASVSERDLTRASALAGGAMGVGTAAGPSVGVALALTGSAEVVWWGLAAGSLLLLFALPARRSASQEEAATASQTGGRS